MLNNMMNACCKESMNMSSYDICRIYLNLSLVYSSSFVVKHSYWDSLDYQYYGQQSRIVIITTG